MENKRKSVDNNTRRIKPRTKESQSQQEPENNAEGHGLDDAIISDDEEGGVRIGDIYIPPPTEPYCSTECKGPRLIIDCIKNYNFKSYAGEVVLGPFHHCFTSIIGPNGSGKSNVIDSMLFVFGYRAQKIRCKKLSVLLHNSALVPNSNRCSVAVCFKQIIDNEDGTYVDVPNSQIIIERVAFRDNTSYYTINGRRAHFREVAKLLKEHSIDLDHNRFLILQGEVESIAMMKPKAQNPNETGMLEYLEDIIGTTRYKEPLIKINSRVDELTEERAEKHNRCKLAEREMKDLEQPYNEAIDYLKLENTLTRTTNLHIQKYLSEQNKKLEEYSVEHDEIAAQLKKHDEEVNCLKEQRKEKEEFLQKEIAQNEKLHRTVETLKTKKEKAKNDGTEIQTRMTVTNKRRKQNKTQLEKLEAELIDLKNLPEKNQAQIGENEKKVVALTKEKAELEEQLQNNYANLEKETKPLIEKREVHTAKLEGLKKDVNEAKAELAVSEHELKILQHDEIVEKRKYESLKTAWEESEVDLNDKQEKFTELETRLPQFVQSIEKKQTELKKNIQEQEVLRGQLLTLRAEITEKQNSFQASRSNNKVLDFLMRQKNNGTIPGILGRLGDLGGIDARYDVAISTACGRLDNIVVDTVNTAQACIEHLRQYNVGRASFIALEKVSHLRNDMRRINTPENAPRLFDLVRVDDDRVLPAFYFALRNTLVADDLEQGTRLAYGPRRYRVVTLGGDVIEISGTMSGGGNTKIRGKMGQNVTTKTRQSLNTSVFTQEMLDKMEQKAVDMQSRVNFLQEEEGRLERELHQITTEKTRSESTFNRLKVAINSLQEQLPRVKIQLQEQKIRMEKTRSDSAKVAELQEIIQDKKETLKLSEDMADKVSTKINEIKKKIDAIHGDKIKTLQNKIEKISKQINTLNGSISKLNVEITSCARNRQKMENKIQNLKTDIDQSEDEIRALDKDRDKLTELIKSIENQIKEATAEINAASSGSSGIKQEIDEIQKKEIEYNLNRVEIEQKLQTIDKKIADVKSQLPHWRNKLRPLKLHTIPSETEPLEPLKTYTEEELATHKLQDIQYLVTVQEQDRDSRKPNLSCIQEYFTKREVYLERVKVLEDITTKRNEMRQLFDDIRKRRYNEFMHGFNIITRKLKEMYQMITQGGDAELELVDSMDPFTEGVSFSVRPPKKTWKNISNLSGGEKTLSSLALVFALHYYKPSPLYFLDEIDAALDFKNISIVAHYIKERTKNAQFIIISLRSNMFELSDYIVGIYKILDCTDSVTIKNFSILDALEIMRQVALPQLKRVMAQPIRRCSPPNTSQTIFNSTGSTVDGIGMGDTVFKRPLPPIKRSLTRMLDIASATAKIQ